MKRAKREGYFHNKSRMDTISGYLFLLPALAGFLLFIGGPIVISVCLSFFDYHLLGSAKFIGLENVKRLFSDSLTAQTFQNTLKFLVILVPVHCILGLLLAYFVYSVKRLKSLYRSAIYFPSIVTTASVAIAWGYIFNTDMGMINYFIRQLGGENVPWLTNEHVAYVTIALFSFWKFIGNSFLYYFIGLQNIPTVYYEAAKIDGANAVKIFTKITIPLLTPTIFFVIITNIINVFQIFDEPYLLTKGGPGTATRSVSYQIYEVAFRQMDIGYGATIAFALFLLVLLVTIIQFAGQKKWVTYDYE